MSLNNPASWAPDETEFQLRLERDWLAGDFVGAVAYGVHATLFFITLKLLIARARSHTKDVIWIAYIVILFTVSSAGNALQLRTAQHAWIDYRAYPGPMFGWEAGNAVAVACNAVYIVNTWLQDSLILYRFWVIVAPGFLFMALPALMFAGTIGIGCVTIFVLTRPGAVVWARRTGDFLTAYFALSITLNIVLTIVIAVRLLTARRNVGMSSASGRAYVGLASVLIESAALYSIFGVAVLVAIGSENIPLQRVLLPIQGQVQSIAPMLIIMRIAEGQAWSMSTRSLLQSDSSDTRVDSTKSSTHADEKALGV